MSVCMCKSYCALHGTRYLVIGAVLFLALAALQQVGGGATGFGHLVLPDGLLGENIPQLFQLITCHFLHEETKWICDERKDFERQKDFGVHVVYTSADMLAMRLNSMLPARTFLRSPGFLGSFKLLIRLRTLFLYFISVAFISW